TCQLFFQFLLLAGYAYAHWAAHVRSPRRLRIIHLTVLIVGILAVIVPTAIFGAPILASDSFKPTGGGSPTQQLLLVLLATCALPFFVVSTTSPLLQRWHSRQEGSLDKTYRLYAVSNAGSLGGLLSYPFFFEWISDISTQAKLWGALFLLFSALYAYITLRASPSFAAVPAKSAP